MNRRTQRRFLRVANRLPSTIITYINNNSGTTNFFDNFLGSPISVCNVRPLNHNPTLNSRTTDLGCNARNVVRNFGDVVLGSRGNRPTPICSITDNLSCPSSNPRRTFLQSINHIGCSIVGSRRAVSTFFHLSHVRNVVPTVRDSRTITCNVGLTRRVKINSILVGLSNHNSGSVSCIVRGCNVHWFGGPSPLIGKSNFYTVRLFYQSVRLSCANVEGGQGGTTRLTGFFTGVCLLFYRGSVC